MKITKNYENLLEGPLLKKILLFVLPLMATNLLQVCYSAADMVVVSLSDVKGALGAIGTTGAMINLIINIFFGFSVGTNVVVARNIGKGDKLATENSVHTSIILAAAFGVIGTVVGLIVNKPILSLLGDEGHILSLAVRYANIYFLGAPFMALANYLIAILRAKGDTHTPFLILSFSGLLNVGLNLFFVLVCKMSVDGVAIATVISNIISTVLLTVKLMRDDSWCRLCLKKLRFCKSAAKEIIYEGLPAGIQGALFSVSNMIIQSSIIGINNTVCPGGSSVIDGNTAASSLEGFIYTATNSVYSAAVTFTSQHYGAKMFKRIGAVMKNCYLVTGTIAVIGTAIMLIFNKQLIGIYVSDELAIETAFTRIKVMITPYFLLSFMEVGSGILRGLGKSITSTVVSLIGSCVLRIIWINTIFVRFPTLEIVYLSYPVSWALTALTHLICSLLVRKKYMRDESSSGAAPVCAKSLS